MASLTIESAVRLGEQLIQDGLITSEQLAEALARQQAEGGKIGHCAARHRRDHDDGSGPSVVQSVSASRDVCCGTG